MASDGNLDVARRLYESINQSFRTGNYQNLGQGIVAEDMIDHNAAPGLAPGLEGLRQFLAGVGASFSDYQVKIEDMLADGDKVITRLSTFGKHTGSFMGAPASGNKVFMEGIEILRIADGLIVERWGIFDLASLMMQIGMMPPPAA